MSTWNCRSPFCEAAAVPLTASIWRIPHVRSSSARWNRSLSCIRRERFVGARSRGPGVGAGFSGCRPTVAGRAASSSRLSKFMRACSPARWLVALAMASMATPAAASDGVFVAGSDMSFARYTSAGTMLNNGSVVLFGPSYDGDEYRKTGGAFSETGTHPRAALWSASVCIGRRRSLGGRRVGERRTHGSLHGVEPRMVVGSVVVGVPHGC